MSQSGSSRPARKVVKQTQASGLNLQPHQDISHPPPRTSIGHRKPRRSRKQLTTDVNALISAREDYLAAQALVGLGNAQPASIFGDVSQSTTNAADSPLHVNASQVPGNGAYPVRTGISTYSAAVTIDVGDGDDREIFNVPKTVLFRSSGYFPIVMNGKWARTNPQTDAVLSEFSPALFNTYLHFLYQHNLDLSPLTEDVYENDEARHNDAYRNMYELYALAMHIQAYSFANKITKRWREYYEETKHLPSLKLCSEAAENLLENCSLRRLIFDLIRHTDPNEMVSSISEMGENLKDDLIWGIFSLVSSGFHVTEDVDRRICEFHEQGLDRSPFHTSKIVEVLSQISIFQCVSFLLLRFAPATQASSSSTSMTNSKVVLSQAWTQSLASQSRIRCTTHSPSTTNSHNSSMMSDPANLIIDRWTAVGAKPMLVPSFEVCDTIATSLPPRTLRRLGAFQVWHCPKKGIMDDLQRSMQSYQHISDIIAMDREIPIPGCPMLVRETITNVSSMHDDKLAPRSC